MGAPKAESIPVLLKYVICWLYFSNWQKILFSSSNLSQLLWCLSVPIVGLMVTKNSVEIFYMRSSSIGHPSSQEEACTDLVKYWLENYFAGRIGCFWDQVPSLESVEIGKLLFQFDLMSVLHQTKMLQLRSFS